MAEGTLVCPACGAIVYREHLQRVAAEAAQLEQAGMWVEARAAWVRALAWLPAETTQAEGIRARVAAIDAREKTAAEKKARWTKRLGPLAPAAFFVMKAKTFLFALLKFKFFFSFFFFFAIYWGLFGWKFAVGFTLSIFVHEMGHYITARRRGLKADLPIFLPGLGAYVRWFHKGVSLRTLAAISLAGPMYGLVSTIVFWGLYVKTRRPVFEALAHTAAWLNLLNLVPVLGLDGAQATYTLNRLQRMLVLVTCVIFYAWLREGVYLFIVAGMTWRLFTNDLPSDEHGDTKTLAQFVLLLFALGVMMYVAPFDAGTMPR